MKIAATLGTTALAVGLHAHTAIAAVTAAAGATPLTAASSGPTPAAAASESTPLELGQPSGMHAGVPSGGGGGLFRTVIGLAVVVALIWGLSWVLRQVKASKEGRATGGGLTSIGTLPLGPGRSVHVVRVGSEVLLLGSADHHISQLGRYTEDEARRLGLLDIETSSPPGPTPTAIVAGGSKLIDTLRSWTVRR